MKFGLDIPITGEYADINKLIDLALDAEKAGWDGFFLWDTLWDSTSPNKDTADPIVALSALALKTKKLRLGLMLTPIVRRRPWKFAKEMVSIDHLSKGRLIVGLGLGFNNNELSNFNEETDPKIRGEKLDEAIEILIGLWKGDEFNFKGKYYRITNVQLKPTPYQKPRIPIWVGGFWPSKKPFRRAAQLDGMYPGVINPDPNSKEDIMTIENFKEIFYYLKTHRQTMDSFDIMHYGFTPNDPYEAGKIVNEWKKAGLTWWAESNDRKTLNEHRERIISGPPKVGE
jgi:alkanesulfonate monooxygenase SsuD/methylene tetrahydromethanopterin reductase-like flavin-dependent oxidoreductase (luciferase family)